MKKYAFFLLLALVVLAVLPAGAEVRNGNRANSLGLRFTGGYSTGSLRHNEGVELSYQRFFSEKTRLEADLGMRIYDYAPETKKVYMTPLVATSFQYRWPIGQTAGFYAGPAIQFGRPFFGLGFGAQSGFDWQFAGPLQLSLDLRTVYSYFFRLDALLSFGVRCSF